MVIGQGGLESIAEITKQEKQIEELAAASEAFFSRSLVLQCQRYSPGLPAPGAAGLKIKEMKTTVSADMTGARNLTKKNNIQI
jgi:hypothetical protein